MKTIAFFLKPRKHHGFTLVELIVVITILVILGTIAFLSLQGYIGSAHDSSRITDIDNISKALDISMIKIGTYPAPDNSFVVTYSGGTIWKQGTVGTTVMNIIGSAGAGISQKPVDPITRAEYIYSIVTSEKSFQLKADLEGDAVAFNEGNYEGIFITQVSADSGTPTTAYVKGNYNGVVANTQTGNIICFLPVPSIIINTGSINQELRIEDNILSGSLIINGTSVQNGEDYNPYDYHPFYCNPASVVINTEATQLALAESVARAYSGTTLASKPSIQPFTQALADTTNSGTLLVNLGGSLVKNYFGISSAMFVASASVSIPFVCPTGYEGDGMAITSGFSQYPIFSPDGGSIVYTNQNDGYKLYKKSASGIDDGAAITNAWVSYSSAYSPDGSTLVYRNTNGKLYKKSSSDGIDDGVAITNAGVYSSVYSPDGYTIVYVGGDYKLYKKSSADGIDDGVAITNGIVMASAPIYSPDGNWIVYVSNGDGRLYKKCANY